jgi:LmbE family N-acetylglucosaminyl deacetylase
MEDTPQRVLVVTPHPDDAEIWCGGTIARWIKEGTEVYYLLCTDGSKGADRPDITPEELAATREKEQLAAAKILGVKAVEMLRRPDGGLEDTPDFRKDIVRQVRLVRPDVVLTTEPYRMNLSWHRDHRITGQVTTDAVFPYARDHLHFMELWRDEKLEPHKTGTILYWGTERPDTFIDISDTLDQKIASVGAHRSQMGGRSDEEIAAFVKERAMEAGSQNGYRYAEAFRKVTFRT